MKKNGSNLLAIALGFTALLLPISLQTGLVHANPNSQETRGSVLYVSSGGVGACTSWADACDLQVALTGAVAEDEIWVVAGTYLPTNTLDRTISFQLKNGVALYGGFIGTESARDQRNWVANPTILSGDIGTTADGSDNSYHVVYGTLLDATATLDGFTITSGNANGAHPFTAGGGMYNNDHSSPTLTNLTFSDNYADYGGGMSNITYSSPALTNITFSINSAIHGGGMRNGFHCNPILTDVTFNANSASGSGGGMYISANSNPSLTNATFSANTSTLGGGMFNYDTSSPTLTDVTFNANSASNSGGGMYNHIFSDPTLTNVTFSDNTAVNDGGGMVNYIGSSPTLINVTFLNNSALFGGGMHNGTGGSPALTNVTFSTNSATLDGGGMVNTDNSNPSLTDVSFSDNTAANDGGGISNCFNSNPILNSTTFFNNSAFSGGGMYNNASNPTLTNTTFSANSASSGGGMVNTNESNPILTNTTFSANSATTSGGGIYNNDSIPTLTNAILWGNTPDQIIDLNYSYAIITYSDIQGGYTGEGNINLDPLLGPLADNGGFTLTHYLGIGSPAIDTASPGVCPATDQRGTSRPIDGDGDAIPGCDMGAYEANPRNLFVDQDALGLDNGTSWIDAFTSLQNGLTEADPGSEVWVAEGTYLPSPTGDRSASFQLKNGVALYGGFAGTETIREQRDCSANPTLLSGDIGVAGNNTDNSYHVIYGTLLDAITILDGFTVTSGNANGSYPNNSGGGMYNTDHSSPTLTNLTFSDNYADIGGGMYNLFYSNPALNNVTFSYNSAYYGGGIYNYLYSSPALTNVTITHNSVGDGDGGGMYNSLFSNPTLINVTLFNNSAWHGGGMYNSDSSPTLTNTILWGAIYNNYSTPVITYSNIMGGYTGEGNINLDPLLGPLADNGGFTMTHALLPGSPAIDTASLAVCPATDQRGYYRPIDGDGNGTPRCDMGAYEYGSVLVFYSYLPLLLH